MEAAQQLTRAEMLRVLAPLGFLFTRDGSGWKQEQTPWPEGMGEWPHMNHGADGNPVTDDRLVEPPGSLRWIAGPRWPKHHNHTVNFTTMVSARGRLFYIIDDSAPGTFGLAEDWQLIARDAFNGTVLWRRSMGKWGWPAWGEGLSGRSRFDQPIDVVRKLVAWGDSVYVVLGMSEPVTRLDVATGNVVQTYVGSEGVSEILYHDSKGTFFVIDGLIWAHAKGAFELLGIDPKTGRVVRRHSTKEAMTTRHHHRCYSNKATTNFILTSRRGIEYLDVRSGENWPNYWIRGACRYGIMPGNGLTYAPPDPCVYYASAKVNGLVAVSGFGKVARAGNRLTKGKAYGQASSPDKPGTDWPTYRHDAERSGSAGTVPDGLRVAWRRDLGGELSGVTVASGRVFVSDLTTRTVRALDEGTGRDLWHFTLPSPVDTPPTLHAGMAMFGSTDGHVYALRASDGEFCWRFRAAPGTRQITAFGRIESAWPVHGSVVIKNGTLYASAGRSSFLDGGINLCALSPQTGELLREHAICAPDAKTGKMTYDPRFCYDMPMAASTPRSKTAR